MRKQFILFLALALFIAIPAFGQQHHDDRGGHSDNAPHQSAPPRGNGGHIPPAPAARSDRHADREGEHVEGGRVDNSHHVNNDHWYGHERADDPRFRMAHPFAHGRFEHFGPGFRYNVLRVDRGSHRFWLPGGFYFQVAPWDWSECAAWCWDCGDDFVVYEDPDHLGWYLLYNVQTGAYVHVQYLGS